VSEPVARREIGAFLEALASDAPTPGGGVVAAVNGAAGAALVSMVCNLTIGRRGYEDVQERMREILPEVERARSAFLQLADEDATAFDGVMAAFAMPKETDAERAARSEAIQRGYEAAAVTPLEIARLACGLLDLAREVTEIGNVNAASDGACGARSLWVAVWSATDNVAINAAALKDADAARPLRDEVSTLRMRAGLALDAADAAFAARVG
jgi:formiminotetrahydrofolate cyclodeaminase